MLTASISDFRRDIKSYLDEVADNFETLIIHRGKGRGIVIMSLDEYNSLAPQGASSRMKQIGNASIRPLQSSQQVMVRANAL